MKKYLILLFIPFLVGAAPTRVSTYTSGETISSSAVTNNEDALFNCCTRSTICRILTDRATRSGSQRRYRVGVSEDEIAELL